MNNKSRKTSHISNIIQFDADGHVVIPASLTLGIAPGADDNSAKVPSTAWVRGIITTAGGGYVPTGRTITINGVSYDLSANRAWSIDTGVLSATAGAGISVSTVSQNLNIVNTGLLSGTAGAGISVSTVNQNLNIVNTGLLTATSGAGISVTTVNQNVNIVNTGLLTATSGAGITVTTSNQNVNIVNTGLLTATAGSGITVTTSNQNINIVNTGILTATAGAGISISVVGQNLNIVNTITDNNQLANGAGYATTSYVTTQINNLVAGAPGLLDTLDELAQALGDDPNFATTISTALGNRLRIDIGTQGLTSTQQGYGRTNLGLGSLASLSSIGNSYITDLAWSKLTGTPTTISGYGITNAYTDAQIQNFFNGANAITGYNKSNWDTAYGWGNHASAGYLTTSSAASTYVSLSGSYANPAWITSLAWSKITGAPAFLTSYTETDTLASVTARGSSTTGSITINGYATLTGGADLNLKAASGSTDTGDIVFQDGSGNELHRLWQGSSTLNYRTNGGTSYQLWHSGNLTNLNQLSNGPGYITGITSSMVTTALGYTPQNSSTAITTSNIGSQSVNYAASAGSVAWTNVSGRPTALSSFTNDIVARTTLNASGDFQFGGQDLAQNNFSLSGATTDTDQFGRYYYSGTSGSIWSRYLPVDKTGRYRMRLRWKATAANTTYLAVILLDTSGNNINGAGTYWAYPWSGAGAPTSWTTSEYWYDGSSFPSNAAYVAFGISHTNYSGGSATYYVSQLEIERYNDKIAGNTILHAGNYNSYAPTLTGGGASGTWGINITGTAASETLATVTARGASTTAGITVNGRVTAAGGGTYAVTGSSTQRYIIQALNTSNSVNSTYGWWWFHNTNGDMGFHADAVGDILTLTRGGGATINGNTIWHAGNDGSGSGLDADVLDGNQPNQTGGAYTIVQRDANGYIQNSYFYMSGGGSERNSSGLGYIAGFNSSDYYVRSYNSTAVASFLGLGSMAYASTGSYLPLSGGTMSGKIFTVSTGTGTYDTAIEIRETGYAGTSQSAWGYSPAMTFHWGGRYAKRFGMRSDGLFAVDGDPIVIQNGGTWGISITGNADTVDGYHASGLWKLNEWNGNLYAHTDGRIYGTIFYDSNDDAYHLNPNSSSRLRYLYVGDSGSNWSNPGSWDTTLYISGVNHSIIRVENRQNNYHAALHSHTGQLPGVGSPGDYDFRITRNWSNRMTFYSGYTYSEGYLQAADSLRAPIFYDSNDTTYYLDPNTGGVSLNIAGSVNAAGSFASNGWSSSSGNEAVRVYAPKGGSASWDGGITGAIRIKLPQRANNTMWSMKVRIYNYSTNQVSEYTMGNYSYDQGGYNASAHFIGAANAPVYNVRFGNQDGVDCVWIGETGTSWSYPVVSVISFEGGFRGGNAATWDDNWNITYVTSFGTVATTIYPNLKVGDLIVNSSVYASTYYDVDNTGYYLNPAGTSNLFRTDILNIYVGNAIYFGGGNNYFNWDGARINSNVSIQSGSDMRAPIFYDSNNTSYYVDPDSTSNVNAITMAGTLFMNGGSYYGTILFGGSSYWRAGISQRDAGNAELRIWAKGGGAGSIYFATGYDGESSATTLPTDGMALKNNKLGIGSWTVNEFPSYKLHVKGDIYADGGGWVRVSGPQGIYFESYGGGWRMTGSSYIEAYNGKSLHMGGASVDYVGSLYFSGAGHIQPNSGSYGALQMTSTRGGWAGIRFTDTENNLMMNSNESGHHRNGYGWQFRWYNGGMYISTNAQGGGSEYQVLHAGNYTSWAAPRNYVGDSYVDFYIYGDQNTYYPVTIQNYNNGHGFQRYSISRGYSWTAPWNPIGTGVHHGGLTFTFDWAGDIAWGGNDKSFRIIEFNENYTTMVAGMQLAHCEGLIVWLRGGGSGGAHYRLHGPGGIAQGYTINMSSWTSCAGVTYSSRSYSGSTVDSEINSRYPVRGSGSGDMYVNNQAVIHSGNIGSQSVSYASSAGNADTVDGYHASNFLGYQGNSYYQVNTWLQMNGTHGLYWPSYNGAHLYVNTTSSYTQLRIDGSRGGYGGIWDSYSAVHGIMYDSSGNGGVYREANGRWYWYHHIGNNCTGISTSTTSSSYRAYIGGSLYAEGDIVAYSDARKKTDIVTIDNALEKVTNLRGVYYTRIDDPDRGRQTGVIAQEINEVLPEVVTYAADVDEYGVSYGNIVGVLIEAIKEQQQQIEELKTKLDGLTK